MHRYIISDIVGVIHDNNSLYKGALEKLEEVKNKGIKLSFLSNNPRRSHKAEKLINDFGITRDYYEFVQTGGELFYDNILSKEESCEAFFIGQEKDLDFANNTNVKLNYVYNSNCKYAIIMGFRNIKDTIQNANEFINTCVKNKLTLYCLNPDLCVVNQKGEISMYCAGMIANKCKQLSCSVIYYGKPYANIYNEVFKKFGNPKKQDVLAIGDTLHTDIQGANDFGVDSVFVRSGVDMNENINQSSIKPKYIYNSFNELVL